MIISHDQLAQKLGAALGANAIGGESPVGTKHIVDGVTPALVCAPDHPEQIVAALRICAEAQASVIPWGGGAAMAIGNPPRRADLVIKTGALNRVIEHDHANLTVTAQSGIVLAKLQERLAPEKQFAPFDPPFPERSTIGGVVAANLNGPRRGSYGSVRDLIIGMKVVLGSAETIKAGGKVVKNVAGYDMCKLFTGSLGSLGIITEVTLRVAPSAERSTTSIASGSLDQIAQAQQDLAAAKLLPTAAFLTHEAQQRNWSLMIRFEGFAAAVGRQLKDWELMVQRAGMKAETVDGEKQDSAWQGVRDFPLQSERLIYRVTVPRGRIIETVRLIEETKGDGERSISADIAMGTLWIAQPPHLDCAREFANLTALARERRGHAVIFAAPTKLKSTIDVWGPPPASFPLMAKVKQQFDPNGILNPGRFIGGL